MNKLIASVLLSIASLAATLPASVDAAGVHTTAQRPLCSIEYIVGRSACYAPAQVATAEAQAPFAVRPSTAVRQVLRLNLSQVIVHWDNPKAKAAAQVDYIYGALRHDYGRAPALPHSVVVTVSRGRVQHLEPRYLQHACGTSFEVSPAALDHSYRSWGPWYLRGNFAHSARQFAIVANVHQPRVLQLACAIRNLG